MRRERGGEYATLGDVAIIHTNKWIKYNACLMCSGATSAWYLLNLCICLLRRRQHFLHRRDVYMHSHTRGTLKMKDAFVFLWLLTKNVHIIQSISTRDSGVKRSPTFCNEPHSISRNATDSFNRTSFATQDFA